MSNLSYAILSIDGGGIRGILPAIVLRELESLIDKKSKGEFTRISEVFDLIAGTSTGGILATGLSVKGENDLPYTAEKLLSIYTGEERKSIFSPRYKILSFFHYIMRSKFPHEGIEGLLKKYFGDAKLKDTLTNLLITSYDTEQKKPYYFYVNHQDAHPPEEEQRDREYFLRDIARATSAAPTYFPPKQVPSNYEERGVLPNSLVDGGVFANNPSVLAYVHGREAWKGTDAYALRKEALNSIFGSPAGKGMAANVSTDNFDFPFLLVSIGTGQTKRPYPHKIASGWGAVKWIQPIIDILMQGVSESVHYQMQYLLPDYIEKAGAKPSPRYYRFNIEIDTAYSNMEDTSQPTIDQLIKYGEQIVEENKVELNKIAGVLRDMARAKKKKSFEVDL